MADVWLVGGGHPLDAHDRLAESVDGRFWPCCRPCFQSDWFLGLMGWTSVRLDMATALVASVALGLSVDDTFHCLLQFRREPPCIPVHREPARELLGHRAGRLVVEPRGRCRLLRRLSLGQVCARSSNFGTMVGIATAGSTLGNLVLLPACLTLGHRFWESLRSRAPKPIAVVSADVRAGDLDPPRQTG